MTAPVNSLFPVQDVNVNRKVPRRLGRGKKTVSGRPGKCRSKFLVHSRRTSGSVTRNCFSVKRSCFQIIMSHITTITQHNKPGQRDMLLTTHEPLPLDPSKDRNKGFARCCFLFGKWFCDPLCSNSAHRVIPLPPCPLPPCPLPPCPFVSLPPAPLPLPPSPPPPRKNKCPTRRSLRTSAPPPLFSLDLEPTLAETNKRKRREKKGCKCILHTEYDVCQYCPAVGCTDCSWINHDLTSHLRPTKKPLIV